MYGLPPGSVSSCYASSDARRPRHPGVFRCRSTPLSQALPDAGQSRRPRRSPTQVDPSFTGRSPIPMQVNPSCTGRSPIPMQVNPSCPRRSYRIHEAEISPEVTFLPPPRRPLHRRALSETAVAWVDWMTFAVAWTIFPRKGESRPARGAARTEMRLAWQGEPRKGDSRPDPGEKSTQRRFSSSPRSRPDGNATCVAGGATQRRIPAYASARGRPRGGGRYRRWSNRGLQIFF